MSSESRLNIFKRRGTGLADLSGMNLATGDMTLEQAHNAGIWHVNATHQIGIATQTEAGLTFDRFPVRVIIVPAGGAAAFMPEAVHTCVSYWKVKNGANEHVRFARKPLPSTRMLKNLYKCVQDLDEKIWAVYIGNLGHVPVELPAEDLEARRNSIYNTLNAENPTAEMWATAGTAVADMLDLCTTNHITPAFKIHDNTYLVGEPHGRDYNDIGNMPASKVALHETACTLLLNYNRIKARYDTVSDGLIYLAAMSIAAMFRFGLQEAHEHQEYYTVFASPAANSATAYTIAAIRRPPGAPDLVGLAVGSPLDLAPVRIDKKAVELANSMVMSSGLMHYLFNHTTGGTIVQGTLLTTLAMYKFITAETPNDAAERITSVMYEALHPVNKRAIANIFLRNTGVLTHGRAATSPRYERFDMDAYMALRCNPYPAGSHKAYIALAAYKRVLQSGLGVFLPWADQAGGFINTCREVLRSGARAHIGSAYYTGEPCASQPASIDDFLPELAAYVRAFHKNDSLSMSPHMSVSYAGGANTNWTNLLKAIKANDVSATSIETVRKFLGTTGNVHFAFDPNNENSWGQAIADTNTALASILNVFNE